MRQLVDIENWNRKELFQFFSAFEEPFFGLCVDVDCTEAYKNAKAAGVSFFLYYFHKSLIAANEIENFRYSIVDGKVYLYNKVDASPVIAREDHSFAFGYVEYNEDWDLFCTEAEKEIQRAKSSTTIFPPCMSDCVIHYTASPWIKFTSLTHARCFSRKDSSPKITFGKITEINERLIMPLSINANHAFVDGYHVGLFIERFQELLNQK